MAVPKGNYNTHIRSSELTLPSMLLFVERVDNVISESADCCHTQAPFLRKR